jgi:molecular chaperone GrpE
VTTSAEEPADAEAAAVSRADTDDTATDLAIVGENADDGTTVGDEQAARERRALIDLIVYAWDRAKSPGVWERLATGLAAVGVEVLRPDGQPFDATRYEAGGVEPTTDPALHDTVAETELAGFVDRGAVIREPVVVVYRLQ